ncbi:MAG TPA: ABC transporter permease [Candidatus Saccharimonadales bacterium]|nr:ABC transporter permease [Candidatus Saccharimonadales bacterium]
MSDKIHRLKGRYRYSTILLKQLVKTDFKLRYQGSVLGYAWSLLRPLFLFVILYFVFGVFLKAQGDIPHYPVYLLLGIVLWNYFSEVTLGGVASIVSNGDLIRKINFPKYVIILAGSFSAFINLLINFGVIAVFMYFGHVELTWKALLMVPLIAELFILSIALAFLLSALFVKFRDVTYIWEVIMQAGFYATPILYPLVLVPHEAAKFLILNPMAQIIQDARYVLVTDKTDTIAQVFGGNTIIWGIPLGLTLILVVAASTYFRRQSRFFAEEV